MIFVDHLEADSVDLNNGVRVGCNLETNEKKKYFKELQIVDVCAFTILKENEMKNF